MVIVHYAGITNNSASGVSVIVPQIVKHQSLCEEVALYNYSKEDISLEGKAVYISSKIFTDDYHLFPKPFERPDLVVFHSPFGIPRMVNITRMLVKDDIPYIVVPHGCFSSVAMNHKLIKKQLAVKIYYRYSISHSSAIQYLSENEHNNSVVDAKSIVISNGIDIPEFQKENTNEINTIIYIGRKDIYQKGIDILINACGTIRELLVKEKVHVFIYGPGTPEQLEMIDSLISQNNLSDIVFNMPPVFNEQKINVLKKSDVFVLTSKSEGQPVAVLEAMSYSLPVLVTPGTGFYEDVIHHSCGVGADETVESVANGMMYMISHPLKMSDAGKNAYNYVRNQYSWNSVTKTAIDTYQRIIYEKNNRL